MVPARNGDLSISYFFQRMSTQIHPPINFLSQSLNTLQKYNTYCQFLNKNPWVNWKLLPDVHRVMLSTWLKDRIKNYNVFSYLYRNQEQTLKVQSCKLYNNKYTIALTQITNTEIFAFIAVVVFKLLSSKVLFINRKRQ